MKIGMKKKLRSRRGMTLMEILCAVAVMGLLTAAIAFSLPAVTSTYRNLTSGAEATVLCSTLSEAVAQELRFASNIRSASGAFASDGGAFIYDSQRFGPNVQLTLCDIDDVACVAARSAKDTDIVYPLISVGAYTSSLEFSGENATRFVYLPEKKLFYVALTVYNAQTQSHVWNEFYVRPLNPPAQSD
ncbi:MAG: type II secretion system protein [Clostridia bacterium]|nr:type II secretion system protein [Clostridia bacterium]